MKAKKFKRTPVPSLVGKGPLDTITRREVVALVAARVPGARLDIGTVSNRISASVYYAVKTGKLREARRGVFRLGDVGAWARVRWPESDFSDLPRSPNKG